MKPNRFVHLHCHTHYSLLDGANRIPELVAQTLKLGMNAIAITDHGNLYGAIEFYQECVAKQVKPIIGYEAYIAPGSRFEKSAARKDAAYHLTLLAQNEVGFRNLIQLSSLAFVEGYRFVPRIDKEILEAHSEGLICLSGCLSGEFNEFLLREDRQSAKKLVSWYERVFGKRFYIELQNNGLEIQDQCTSQAVEIANQMGLPLVATADAHYLCQNDAAAHDVLICINTGAKRSDEKRMRYGDDSRFKNPFYVRSPQDMYDLFPSLHDAVARSQEIADLVDIRLDFKKRHFPIFTPPNGQSSEDFLRNLCFEGMEKRYTSKPRSDVRARLEHELSIICRMGFASYFLIVWDFVRFARETGIPCSARGSGCGAVVSYVLFLSHVDPLEYDLLFERFLDPNRSEAPDIDIDFCQERRELVIDYVKRKYGESSVAQIATFGTMAAKAAIKDVGRVLDIPLDRVNYLTKMISSKPGTTLEDSLNDSVDFRREYDTDPVVTELVDIALRLEGTNRNAGTHAAGVVIANGAITNYVPVQLVNRKEDSNGHKEQRKTITTQWVMGDLETVGMLKMDFLGLRTLTLVDHTLRLIRETRGEEVDIFKIPLDDPETYKMLQRGDAKGVFQFESEGIRELLKRMRPDNIRDIIASTALYRPGPLEGGMVDEYINCKHGRKQPVYPHKIMEDVLGETYGVMCYQEQVMRILNRLGNIELSSAYACIKAISKKKQEIIDARRNDFIKGCLEQGLERAKSEEIFGLIEKFGGYGFNKSHSAAYAQLSYQTAYLKRHYTAEFFAALLSSEIDDSNKRDILVDHFNDARKFGIEILPPNINEGEVVFSVKNGKIVFGLTAIKGLGRSAAEAIVQERNANGAFKDLYELCERVDSRTVSKMALEKLIKAGAMDQFGQPIGHRAQLLVALPSAVQSAGDRQEDRQRGQMSMFDLMESDPQNDSTNLQISLPNVPVWHNRDQLKFEKEALDFYFSSHPLADVEKDLGRFATHPIVEVFKLDDGTEVRIGGMLVQTRITTTRRGDPMVRCKIEDLTGQLDALMWPSDFSRFRDYFVDDKIYLFDGRLERQNRDEPSLVLQKLITIEQAKKELTKGLILKLNLAEHHHEAVVAIARVLRRVPGPCQVYLHVRDPLGNLARFKIGDDYRVNPAMLPIDELETMLGQGAVIFSGRG